MTTRGLLVGLGLVLAYAVIIAGTWLGLFVLAAAARAHIYLF